MLTNEGTMERLEPLLSNTKQVEIFGLKESETTTEENRPRKEVELKATGREVLKAKCCY